MPAQHWDDSFLDAMRLVGDPPADALLTQLVNRHGIERVDRLMVSLVRNDDLGMAARWNDAQGWEKRPPICHGGGDRRVGVRVDT